MSEKRNLIVFVFASMLLFMGYSWLTKNETQKQPRPIPIDRTAPIPQTQVGQTTNVAPATSQAQLGATATMHQESHSVQQQNVDKDKRYTNGNSMLELTWRQHDGAIVQAVWKKDNTHFFPVAGRDANGGQNPEFLGVGGAVTSIFSGAPQVTEGEDGKTISFSNPDGETLAYYLPNDGHILDVRWHSPSQNNLYLLRTIRDIPIAINPYTGKQFPANPFHGLEKAGRIYAIEEKKVYASTWDGMLTDPWFKFLGRKRKELPPASTRLGMDAGVEPTRKQPTHYFAAIWDSDRLPMRDTDNHPGFYQLPDTGGNATARLYLGPKQAEALAAFHPEGQPEKGKVFLQAMDFGFFGVIAKFLFVALRAIQSYIPNWGWSLVVFGVLIRLVLWPLNTKVTLGMLRQKDLEPHQKAIQAKYEKYTDMAKKAEMQKELRDYWKKNGHNPMGSCLPMLIQFPVFMALWSMLQNVFELRHAPWIFWIKDLSGLDPYYILPILMAGTMMARSAMMPPMGDPMQRKMMMVFMPIMMGVFFAMITPAGLMVYYLMYNLVDMAQAWWVMRNYKPQPVVI